MEIGEAKKRQRLKEWAEMVQSCRSSGQTVQVWCAFQGINPKTYYYRLRKVRLAMLQEIGDTQALRSNAAPTASVFAELDFHREGSEPPSAKTSVALSIHIGKAVVDIYDRADAGTIGSTLRIVSKIC